MLSTVGGLKIYKITEPVCVGSPMIALSDVGDKVIRNLDGKLKEVLPIKLDLVEIYQVNHSTSLITANIILRVYISKHDFQGKDTLSHTHLSISHRSLLPMLPYVQSSVSCIEDMF